MLIWGASWGDGNDFGSIMFSPYHVATNEEDLWLDWAEYPRYTNYWITAPQKTGPDAQLFFYFGCPRTIRGFLIKNTHNFEWNNMGTENFKIYKSEKQTGN